VRQGEADWPKVCRALRLEHLVDDARFANAKLRRSNGPELVDLLDAAFADRDLTDIAAALDAEEIIWAPVLTAAEAIADPQTLASGAVVQTPQRDGGHINAPGAPIRFPGANDGPKGPAPLIGEHTRAVLAELGYSDVDIDALYASGAAA
jgi:crotonobetainyl-CoA:carnitine CoA-transferase CaiB-like acyl-CoA transferase